VKDLFSKHAIDTVVHFAAESHVDRSIHGPRDFIQTNIIGTFNLLEAAQVHWKDRRDVLFHHVSTDEVYGSAEEGGYFFETTPYDPHSPYAASKASSDHLVLSYFHTYGLPVTLSNCSNNYGPYQFPEKMIPVLILNILERKPLPIYGKGENVRDWLYVEDHAEALWLILQKGMEGQTYNVGGDCAIRNIDLVHLLLDRSAQKLVVAREELEELITFVKDRPGHDLRYAINCKKIRDELGWTRHTPIEEGLDKTLEWYMSHEQWVRNVRTEEYKKWLDINYARRDRG
jgi:dTDP-glucose 4,6-dehydratase